MDLGNNTPPKHDALILKVAIFATGVSGIVAEYMLATMATYFLGDSIFQWTMIVSVMLFSMGIGSLISRRFSTELLVWFIVLELVLSLVASFSGILVYVAAGYFKAYVGLFIYSLSIGIGLLVGMEIPLVTRINESFQTLKYNISSILAMDYVGSLIGGMFFVFVSLPFFGLTYTPFIVGGINFIVTLFLLPLIGQLVSQKKWIYTGCAGVGVLLLGGVLFSDQIRLISEQKRYKEKIIYQKQSRYQNIIITQKKDVFWLFLNGNQQLSTFDEYVYHEALVHPAMQLSTQKTNVLILGGGDGCTAREVLKYHDVRSITVVDLDSVVTNLARDYWVLSDLNQGSLSNPKVQIVNQDAFSWLEEQKLRFDVILIDLPDPKTIDIARMYSKEFYYVCKNHLTDGGTMITQAGSPMFASEAFYCVSNTMRAAGLSTLPLHNHVLTLGEWGYVLAKKIPQEELNALKNQLRFDQNIQTSWLNDEAFVGMYSFAKPTHSIQEVQTNTMSNPILQRYYLNGEWALYN